MQGKGDHRKVVWGQRCNPPMAIIAGMFQSSKDPALSVKVKNVSKLSLFKHFLSILEAFFVKSEKPTKRQSNGGG